LVLLVGAGVRATPGILILPLEHEFGWSNATISTAIAINILLYGLLGPFAVALIERFGLRRTVCASLLLLTIGRPQKNPQRRRKPMLPDQPARSASSISTVPFWLRARRSP
jgi:cyanate permease